MNIEKIKLDNDWNSFIVIFETELSYEFK